MERTSDGDQPGTNPVATPVTVTVDRHGPAVVLSVHGEIDLATAPQLAESIGLAMRERPPVLIVDLTECGLFSSAGLNALIAARRDCGEHTELRLVIATRTAALTTGRSARPRSGG
ncbi:STAS domain-containing protein [Amycolatopsis anabasis]|uniref:STAS domain-containing protein n=1 Tax=Amycolatopsis anabasis TaxID=1840409 RepID=UPI00131E8C90|nr:STAS domain-containing protein [Amycolatopsis anabasis]